MAGEPDQAWVVRARRTSPTQARVYARNHVFAVGAQASLRDRDEHPSAIEYLLGALAGDLLRGFEAQAERRGVLVEAGEVHLQARLNNVLFQLGVVGESGHAALESVSGTLYVSTDASETVLDELWSVTLERSPLYQTLARCAEMDIRLREAP